MNKIIDSPLFCLTSDVDWASDYAIEDFITLVSGYGIRPTVFATHRSAALEQHQTAGAIELGIHPNFLPGSSHGSDYIAVIDHMLREFPNAKSFRSHCFFDSALVTQEMVKRGFTHDSNLCVYLQPRLVPLRHASGLIRFPVFWEDDVHWLQTPGDWDVDRWLTSFLSPGLKVLNFHPFFVAANIPNQDYYLKIKGHIKTVTAQNIASVRFKGAGARTFLVQLLEQLTARRQRFYTLAELYRLLPIDEILLAAPGQAQEPHAG